MWCLLVLIEKLVVNGREKKTEGGLLSWLLVDILDIVDKQTDLISSDKTFGPFISSSDEA